MPSLQYAMISSSNPAIDEHRWVIQVRRTLEEELEEDTEIPVSIFNVPKTLMASDPDSYVPQQVAIGPYHYWRPELYEMERYKLAAAKRVQKQLQSVKFEQLVAQLVKFEPKIRASYHKYLDINGETLAWMMAVDAAFLLEFLHVYAKKEGKELTRISSRMSHLVDSTGRKSAHNSILKDMVMLENQIPLFLLREILEVQFSSLEMADKVLLRMLKGICKELSPFVTMEEPTDVHVADSAHLLDFLYYLILPKPEVSSEITHEADDHQEGKEGEEKSSERPSQNWKHLVALWNLLWKVNKGPVRLLKRVLLSKPLKVAVKLPWTIISNVPGLKMLKGPMEAFFSQGKEDAKTDNENSDSNNDIIKPPLVEEISIPTVSELLKSGVCFVPTNGGISTISFDKKTFTLYLPTVSLDVNTEVILRNLVAYEACNSSGALVFTRFIELMSGIVDTEEDAKLLRERGIILNRLKSDAEVANLWNGNSKSVKLTKVPFLDEVITDVNKHYSRRWKVKLGKFMKVYVFGSWQLLTLLAAIVFLALTILQAFCSVFTCSRVFQLPEIGSTD